MSVKTPSSLLKSCGLFALTILALSVESATAATFHTVNLAWNAVPEPGIQGYRVYAGTATGVYSQTFEVGTSLSVPVPSREFGQTYYFSVKAIGSTGLESPYAQELVVTIAPPPLPLGGGLTVNGSGQRALNWTFPKASLGSSPEFIIEQSTNLVNWTVAATVQPSASTGGTTQIANFSWPVAISGTRRFYRLTAKNWMGMSTTP
jgi:hypothetical protein